MSERAMTPTEDNVSPYLKLPLRSEEEARRAKCGVVDGKLGCDYCKGEPDPGYIEMPNNGPIVPCPLCNKEDGRG